MSLSNGYTGSDAPVAAAPEERRWGRIFIGLNERDLDGVERVRETAWTEKDEESYLARVREKAEAKAISILEQATAEAAALREAARQEGYAAGMVEAEAELNEFRNAVADSSGAVLAAIEAQAGAVLREWREDLTSLLRIAVEKAVGITLNEERRAVLEALYLEAVQTLESHRVLTVRANPEDEAVVADIMDMTQARHTDLHSWKVKADASVPPGGLIVESESSLADNRMESRMQAINQTLEHLFLPSRSNGS